MQTVHDAVGVCNMIGIGGVLGAGAACICSWVVSGCGVGADIPRGVGGVCGGGGGRAHGRMRRPQRRHCLRLRHLTEPRRGHWPDRRLLCASMRAGNPMPLCCVAPPMHIRKRVSYGYRWRLLCSCCMTIKHAFTPCTDAHLNGTKPCVHVLVEPVARCLVAPHAVLQATFI